VHESGEVVAHAELNLLPQHRLGQVRRVAVAPRRAGGELVAPICRELCNSASMNWRCTVLSWSSFPSMSRHDAATRRSGSGKGRAREARVATNGYWDLIYMALLEENFYGQRASSN
jgi:hypothetical protein